jgi:hypothetical protein
MASFFFCFSLGNIAFPFTQFFIRIIDLIDLANENKFLPYCLVIGVTLLSAISALWIFVRVFAETINIHSIIAIYT